MKEHSSRPSTVWMPLKAFWFVNFSQNRLLVWFLSLHKLLVCLLYAIVIHILFGKKKKKKFIFSVGWSTPLVVWTMLLLSFYSVCLFSNCCYSFLGMSERLSCLTLSWTLLSLNYCFVLTEFIQNHLKFCSHVTLAIDPDWLSTRLHLIAWLFKTTSTDFSR